VSRLAERLAPEAVRAIYSSPLGRTVETAEILAKSHRLEVKPRDGLREISHGRWEGLTRQEVETRFPPWTGCPRRTTWRRRRILSPTTRNRSFST